MITLTSALTVACVLAYFGGLWYFSNLAGKIHNQLSEYRKTAEITNTQEELQKLDDEVLAYAKKECWHRHLSSHACEVLQFIRGKKSILRNLNL